MGNDQFLIETDIIASFLRTGGDPVPLRSALAAGVCYTTTINSIELFAACTSDSDRHVLTHTLSLMRVLGIHPKLSEQIGELSVKLMGAAPLRDLIVLGMARVSKLTIITRTRRDYFRDMAKKAELLEIRVVASIAEFDSDRPSESLSRGVNTRTIVLSDHSIV